MEEYFSKDRRAIVSLGGECSFGCTHCYTFDKTFKTINSQMTNLSSIRDITNNLRDGNAFDIIYVSGYRENFIEQEEGLNLIEKLFSDFNCHILFTTRNVFDSKHILRINKLNKTMKSSGKHLFACVSISAYDSYKKLEPSDIIPSPEMRLEFLKQLYENGITTFLALRPIFPDSFIPTTEYLKIIEKSYNFCDVVITSGVYITNDVLKRLKNFPKNYISKSKNWDCFGNTPIEEIDVIKELSQIDKFCEKKIPVFRGSIPAINHFYTKITKPTYN